MKDAAHTASLYTYLETHDKEFYIKISPSFQDNALLERSLYPFLVINESDPISRLIEARIVSDADSEVRRLFLLVQQDNYLVKKDELWPLNNRDLNDSWQKAFSFFTEQKQDNSFILFSDQTGRKGELLPFASLFYCKTKKLFFHPPCPKCGLPLLQCEDDVLLKSAGIQPFSGSLKRVLFCSACSSPEGLNFYVYESEQSDPPAVKDRMALIKEFGLLRDVNKESTAFPCNDCQLHQECYGTEQQVITRIVPFSFYPFYMLAFGAMSLNALDFIPLLSGATFEEVKTVLEDKHEFGRINCLEAVRENCTKGAPFLFNSDERYFLEVLYLKLSFLGEVIQNLRSGDSLFRHPDLRLSPDQIWIKLTDQGGLLPFYWNFKVCFMDLNRPHAVPPPFQKPASDSLFFMGLFWFYTLLVNRQQNIREISGALGKMTCSEDDVSFEKLVHETTFLPVNIFWNPDNKNINNNWNPLWEKSLNLGWLLLKAGFQNASSWNEKEFHQELENLRGEIKDNLFRKEIPYSIPVLQAEDKPVNHSEDQAIHEILMGIYNRRQSAQAVPVPANDIKQEEKIEDMTSETVIISTQKTVPSVEAEEDLQKTVILSLKDAALTPPSPPYKGGARGGERPFSDEPVMSPGLTKENENVIPTKVGIQGNALVLDSRFHGNDGSGSRTTDTVTGLSDELTMETVILSPKGTVPNAGETAKETEKPEEPRYKEIPVEDFLAETVILKPGEKGKSDSKR